MHIAIDASRTTAARVTGTEHYALQMIRALIRLDSPHTFTLYFRGAPAPDLFPAHPRVRIKLIPFPRLWTHARFALALAHDRPDLVWVPAHTLPFAFPGRAAVTIHDLGYRHFPDAHPANARRYLDFTTRTSAARASIILADSRATADDLTRFYGTAPEKIRIVYPGVDPLPVSDVEAVRAKYHLPERYFLFIGTLQPRKNIARIAQAYRQYAMTHPNARIGLVLAGGVGWLYDPAWTAGVAGIVMPGYIDDADKGALYRGAVALVFPSLYEGFGFPVIEAMGCETPVICSNTSSLPELADNAALQVDPLDTRAIAEAMARITDEPEMRAALIGRGKSQAAQFTWDSAARTAMGALEAAQAQ